MATTTNYSWTTPDDTALVKDGAAAIRSLGSAIDTTTKALNPSTTLGDIEYRSSTANTNARLGIGTSGQVLTVNGSGVPAWTTVASGSTYAGASVYMTANQSISNNSTNTVNFNAENFDTDGFHDNATNNSRLTVPSGKAGKYLVNYQAAFIFNSTGIREASIRLNGSTTVGLVSLLPTGSSDQWIVSVNSILNLSVGDYVEARLLQNSGGALNALSGAWVNVFSISYLGA